MLLTLPARFRVLAYVAGVLGRTATLATKGLTFVDIGVCTLTNLGFLLPCRRSALETEGIERLTESLTSVSRRRVLFGCQIHD